jgi:hypothetical protein
MKTKEEILVEIYGCKDVKDLEDYFGIEMLSKSMILEAMQLYADEQSAKAVKAREEEIRGWIGKNSNFNKPAFLAPRFSVDSNELQEFISTPSQVEPTQEAKQSHLLDKTKLSDFIEKESYEVDGMRIILTNALLKFIKDEALHNI